jgi:hypothetical protein
MPQRVKVRIQKRRELTAIAAFLDREIDISDIRNLPLETWKNAVRGRFYRSQA